MISISMLVTLAFTLPAIGHTLSRQVQSHVPAQIEAQALEVTVLGLLQ
jgi:hypothetical protein